MKEIKTYLVITPFFPSSSNHKGIYIYDQLNQIRKKKNFKIKVVKLVSIFSREKNYMRVSNKCVKKLCSTERGPFECQNNGTCIPDTPQSMTMGSKCICQVLSMFQSNKLP